MGPEAMLFDAPRHERTRHFPSRSLDPAMAEAEEETPERLD